MPPCYVQCLFLFMYFIANQDIDELETLESKSIHDIPSLTLEAA